jgi:hypothetical protein
MEKGAISGADAGAYVHSLREVDCADGIKGMGIPPNCSAGLKGNF